MLQSFHEIFRRKLGKFIEVKKIRLQAGVIIGEERVKWPLYDSMKFYDTFLINKVSETNARSYYSSFSFNCYFTFEKN